MTDPQIQLRAQAASLAVLEPAYRKALARETALIEERDRLRSALRGIASTLRYGRAKDADLLQSIRNTLKEVTL